MKSWDGPKYNGYFRLNFMKIYAVLSILMTDIYWSLFTNRNHGLARCIHMCHYVLSTNRTMRAVIVAYQRHSLPYPTLSYAIRKRTIFIWDAKYTYILNLHVHMAICGNKYVKHVINGVVNHSKYRNIFNSTVAVQQRVAYLGPIDKQPRNV